MLLKIHHRTHYRFEHPVPYGLQRLRLIPKENAAQHIVRWDTNIEGGKVEADYLDFHNNHILLVSIDESATEIVVTCDGEVETSDTKGILGKHGGYVPLWYFLKPTRLTEPSKEIQALARASQKEGDDALAALPAGHLFEGNTTRIAFRRDTWLRGYDYDFMELLAPQLTRGMVEATLKGEGADPGL